MDFPWVTFIIVTVGVAGAIIFLFKQFMFSTTEGALKRLDEEIGKANQKQQELSEKIKLANEELEKRKIEAKELASKMTADAEAASKAEREKIINKARQEGEEIIAKAQSAKDKLRQELEKENDIKTIEQAMEILNSFFSQKAREGLDKALIDEFLDKLKDVDMSRISLDVKSAELVCPGSLDDGIKGRFSQLIKEKLSRDIAITTTTDPKICGGVILKFGTMALDGSLRNFIRESGISKVQAVESR